MMNAKKRYDSEQTIVIRRDDVNHIEAYARDHCDLRDYLMIRLPKKIGLRTHEIGTLKIENINFQSRSFQVLDSKKKRLYPLPLDVLTLELIQELVQGRSEGVVFLHKNWKRRNQGKPLTNVSIWKTVRLIGEAAGVKGFHPRVLRHFFAANWIYVQKKSMESLRRILRHKNLRVTHSYLSRLVFFEDVQKEYDEIRAGPFIEQPPLGSNPSPLKAPNYQKWCSKCDHEHLCKFINDFCSSDYAASCKYFMVKEQINVPNGTIIKKLTV